MAKCSLSKNLHKLNFSRRQIEFFRPMILIGYKMAKLLSDKTIENLSIKDKAISIVNEWNSAMSELIAVMLESKEFKED